MPHLLRDVADEVRDLREARFQEGPYGGLHAGLVERGPHAAQPRIAHRDIDPHVGVAHAQARVRLRVLRDM